MTTTEDTLEDISFFAGVSKKHLKRIAGLMTPIDVPAGKVLAKQGTIGREFFVILDGQATVTRDGRTIASLGVGDHFGEVSLLDAVPRTATVTADTPMTVEVLSRAEFVELLDEAPQVTRQLLRSLAEIVEREAGF